MKNEFWKTSFFIVWCLLAASTLYAFFFQPNLLPLIFAAGFVLSALAFLCLTVASTVHRIRSAKHIFTPHFEDALFSQRWVSGNNHRQFALGKLPLGKSSASNCLWVAILPDRLRVGPMFPLSMMPFPEEFQIEYDLLASDVVKVVEQSTRWGRTTIALTFRFESRSDNEIHLIVRKASDFFDAISSLSESVVVHRLT